MGLALTYRRRLHEHALNQYGYVTTEDAEDLGVPAGELAKLKGRGGLEHIGHGLYRFEDIPRTGRDQFMEAVLRVGRDAYLTGDAVLALHDLALVNPRRIKVAVPRRDRHKLPEFIQLIRQDIPADERTVYDGIPGTTVARALLDCRGEVMDDRLIDAVQEAARQGLLRRRDTERVLAELGADSGSMPDAPSNVRSLQRRIENLARTQDRPVRRLQRAISNTAVGQMLPPGVIKGGTALKLRFGESASRFTPDLDAARAASLSLDDYLDQLEDRLETGWGGFTGTVAVIEPKAPEDVPDEYAMRPFDIRLAYRGSHWLTVRFELGRDEVGSTAVTDDRLATDVMELFETLGLPTPSPLPLMTTEHQIAQKLHACTTPNPKTGTNERAHDLVDLQILIEDEQVDLGELNDIARRLFAARKTTHWPPTVRAYEHWDTLYAEAAAGLNVIPQVGDAVDWTNQLIQETARAGS